MRNLGSVIWRIGTVAFVGAIGWACWVALTLYSVGVCILIAAAGFGVMLLGDRMVQYAERHQSPRKAVPGDIGMP